MIGILYHCDKDKVRETIQTALERHVNKFSTEAHAIYVNPVNFSDYDEIAREMGLAVIKDRTILLNHFWISENVKN